MMKVALYARVSTEDQDVGNQVTALERYAENHDYSYEVYEEVGSTRKTRPIKEELMEELLRKEYDAVVVWKIDRWARSLKELVLDIEKLQEKDVAFVSITDNIDLTTSTGRLQFNIIASFAQFERDLISERTKEGLKNSDKSPGRPKAQFNRRRAYYLLFEEDESLQAVADEVGVSKPTIHRFKKECKENPPSFIKEVNGSKSGDKETTGGWVE